MDIQLFIENLDTLSDAEFRQFSVEVASLTVGAERSACLALCAQGTGDTDAALCWVDDVIAIGSSSDFVSFAVASVRLQTGNMTAAIGPLQNVSERFPKQRDALVLLATALLYADRLDEADTIAASICEQDDAMRGTLLALRARCAEGRADETAAYGLYREALMYDPSLEWVRQALRGQRNVRADSPNGLPDVIII